MEISRSLPDHLGWGSETLTKLWRASQPPPAQDPPNGQEGKSPDERSSLPQPGLPRATPPPDPSTSTVKIFPDIALALLREQLVAPGRLWLLLRFIDPAGRGWIDIDGARGQLASKGAPLRTVGWRQMRKLLARGDGLFWQRDSRRIWLRSPLKVAASLGIDRLNYRPVGLPVMELQQSIGQVRAHFYASFHSARSPEKPGGKPPPPIARATLEELCQVSRRTQRAYERRANVHTQRNFALGRPLTVADHQIQAWARGRAVFRISDRTGRAGRQGATYTAWQLPNSYQGPHEKQPKGRQKRMNHKLADLFMKGMTGNGQRAVQTQHFVDGQGNQRFFGNGATAATHYNRQSRGDAYWPCRPRTPGSGSQRCQLWHWLPSAHSLPAPPIYSSKQ